MAIQRFTDIYGETKVVYGKGSRDTSGEFLVVTAGGALDDTEVTGAAIDTANRWESGYAIVNYDTKLTSAKTLTMLVKYQFSDDNSTWDTAVEYYAAAVVATGTTSTTTFGGSLKCDQLTFKDQKRYVRFNVTPTLSATATDTASWSTTLVLGGGKRLPAT